MTTPNPDDLPPTNTPEPEAPPPKVGTPLRCNRVIRGRDARCYLAPRHEGKCQP